MATAMLYLLLVLAVVGGLAMVVQRNPIHAALSLLGSMLCLAAVYALLQAHLLAALQVIIYAGAIVILIVYIIMLLQIGTDDVAVAFRRPWLWSLPVIVLFAILFSKALFPVDTASAAGLSAGEIACVGGECERDCTDGRDTDGDGMTDCADVDCGSHEACYGTVRAVGAQLLGPYVLAFEVSSLLLLAGIVGSVLLTGRRPKELADEITDPEVAELDPTVAQAGGHVREQGGDE